MVQPTRSDEARPRPGSPPPSVLVRLLVYGVAWLPFCVRFNFHLPGFIPIFARIQERGNLPTLSALAMRAGEANQDSFGLLTLMMLASIFAGEVYFGAKARQGNSRLYWAWFLGVIVVGLVALLALEAALLLPVFALSADVK